MIVSVLVEVNVNKINKTFDYNVPDLLKDSITLIDGKGGGSKELAQGGGKNVANMENAIEYSIRKVRGTR